MELPLEARWLFVTLLLSADDFGIFEATPYDLADRAKVSKAHVPALLQMMVDVDLLRLYTVERQTFGFIPRFRQRIQVRRIKHPPPPPALLRDEPEVARSITALQMRDKTVTPKGGASLSEFTPTINNLPGAIREEITESHGNSPLTRAKKREARSEPPEFTGPSGLVNGGAGAPVDLSPEAFELSAEKAPTYRCPPCPVQQLVGMYHRHLPMGSRCDILTDRRGMDVINLLVTLGVVIFPERAGAG